MPIESKIDQSGLLTTHVVTGKLSAEMIINSIKAFYRKKPTKNVIWDCRDTEPDTLLTYSAIEDIVRLTKEHANRRESGKTALVVSTDETFGLGRMYEILADISDLPHSVRVFRSMDEATSWIREKAQ